MASGVAVGRAAAEVRRHLGGAVRLAIAARSSPLTVMNQLVAGGQLVAGHRVELGLLRNRTSGAPPFHAAAVRLQRFTIEIETLMARWSIRTRVAARPGRTGRNRWVHAEGAFAESETRSDCRRSLYHPYSADSRCITVVRWLSSGLRGDQTATIALAATSGRVAAADRLPLMEGGALVASAGRRRRCRCSTTRMFDLSVTMSQRTGGRSSTTPRRRVAARQRHV